MRSMIISVAVHANNNIKIEKYRGRSQIFKNLGWVCIKLNAAFILFMWLRQRVELPMQKLQ